MASRNSRHGWLAPIAIAALAACLPAASASAKEACRVEFTDVQLEPYQSGGRTMYRVKLAGEHNFNPATDNGGSAITPFSTSDGDGFLMISAFGARWLNGDDRSVRVPRAELRSLRSAVEMGQAYYTRLIEIISAEPRPANYDSMLNRSEEKLALLGEILAIIDEASGYRSADDTELLGSAPWLRLQLARFRPGASERMMSQYRDHLLDDRPMLLCDQAAANVLMGRLLCPQPVSSEGTSNANDLCSDGMMVSAILIPEFGT